MKTKNTTKKAAKATATWAASADYARKHCPKLLEHRLSLIPFDSLINSESADEGKLCISTDVPGADNLQYWFNIYADGRVEVEHVEWKDGEIELWEPVCTMTMRQLWNFLAQMPRSAADFAG